MGDNFPRHELLRQWTHIS